MFGREITALGVGMLFFAILAVVGCGKKPEPAAAQKERTVVFFGDSIVYGYGVNRETESFYARIEKVMVAGLFGPVKTINAGVSGNDTDEALRRVTNDVTVHNPDIVIIAFGLNDCQNRAMTVERFRANIENIIAAMPAKTKVVLATSNSFLESGQSMWEDLNDSLEPFMAEIRTLAAEKKYPLIDVNSLWNEQLDRDNRHLESYYVDPTHPSAKGHGLIYEAYMGVLRRMLAAK